MKIVYKIFKIMFSKIKPFNLSYSNMDRGLFIIGIRYNKFREIGYPGLHNSLGIFYGRNYKVLSWLS